MNGPTMDEFPIDRRAVLRGVMGACAASSLPATAVAAAQERPATDPHTRVTFAAAVDAIVPPTPELGDELGEEHVPGAAAVGLSEYLITYVNNLFSNVNPEGDETGNLRLAEAVAVLVDEAAAELVAEGGTTEQPSLSYTRDLLDRSITLGEAVDAAAGGPFARLSRRDRLRALAEFDEAEKKFDTASLPGPTYEWNTGLLATLVVAFAEVLYYSEWDGYEAYRVPPSDREFDPGSVQSFAQTDFGGFVDGAAALRGYWSAPGSSLGEGRVWKRLDEGDRPAFIRMEPGSFRENDYDTGGYEEPFDTSATPASSFGGSEVQRRRDADEAAREELGDGTLDRLRERVEGLAGVPDGRE